MTDRNDGRPRHSASHIHCAVPFFLCPKRNGGGGAKAFGGEWVVGSARNAWRSLRACVWAAGMWQEGRGRARRCAGAGADLRRGMGGEVGGRASALRGGAKVLGKGVSLCGGGSRSSAGNGLCGRRGLTHFRRSRSRVRVLLYIRPPRHRCEIAAMGPKDAPCEHPSPAKTSAPAASAFIFPRRRSHFLRIPFGLPLNDVRPCRPVVHTSPAYPSAAPTKISASRSSSYPQWVIHGKVIHIVARHPVQNVLVLAPAHAYI